MLNINAAKLLFLFFFFCSYTFGMTQEKRKAFILQKTNLILTTLQEGYANPNSTAVFEQFKLWANNDVYCTMIPSLITCYAEVYKERIQIRSNTGDSANHRTIFCDHCFLVKEMNKKRETLLANFQKAIQKSK